MNLTSKTSVAEADNPLREFIDRHGLAPLIETATQIAEQCFPLEAPILIRKVEDPESDDEWVEMRLRAHGDLQDVGEAHDRYTRRWLESVPANKALMVRLAIRIA